MVLMKYLAYQLFGLLLVFSLGAVPVLAQQGAPAKDTVQTIIPADTSRKILDSDKILQELKAISKRKTVIGRLTKAVFRFDRKPEPIAANVQLLSNQYEQHNYKIVRRIEIRSLNAFGYSLNDTTRVPANFLEKNR